MGHDDIAFNTLMRTWRERAKDLRSDINKELDKDGAGGWSHPQRRRMAAAMEEVLKLETIFDEGVLASSPSGTAGVL